MDFSNRHTNEFVYACDLERVLGGVSVCNAGVKGSCVNTAVVNGVNVAIFDCTGGNGEEVKNSFYCHSVPDTESEICACANTNANSPRHICESKLGRGDFLVRVGEYLKKSVRAQIEVNPQPSYAHLAWLLPINESSCFASQKHSALWQQSALPSLGEGKTSHADTKGITSADHSCHAELDSASDQRRMDKFSVSRHCERSEAIQEEMVSNRLLRRFTPRNDNKKAGVK